jgi:hypothetical protein
MTGRYRNDKAASKRPWWALLAICALLFAAAATVNARDGSDDRAAGSGETTADSFGQSDTRAGSADRSYGRHDTDEDEDELDDATDARPEPRASATVLGPTVEDRRQPAPVQPPQSGDGTYQVVPGDIAVAEGSDNVVEYIVEVEEGLPFDPDDFADDVHEILNDERGWGHADGTRFERVDDDSAAFRVSLSSPDMTDEQCYPLRTRGEVSCWNGSRAVINAERWGTGADTYGDDLLSYREYLINHEVGHALGHGHVNCPADGDPSPVMVQQTKSLEGCDPNPWPALADTADH